MASEAISDWFKDLVLSAAKPVFDLLSATALGTPEMSSDSMKRVRELWSTSQWIANTCFVLLITIAGVLIMAGHSLPTEISPKEIFPRLLLAFLASNLSQILIGYGITFANGLADAFLTTGSNSITPERAGEVIAAGIQASLTTDRIFFTLVTLVAVILALFVAFIYVVRLVITMVLIAAAPLALMFHALPVTDGIAKLWWRGMTGMLAIQVCQALVLVGAMRVLFAESNNGGSFIGVPTSKQGTVDLLLVICLLWIMIKIPSWVARTIWHSAQPRMLGQLVRSFVMYQTLGAILGSASRRGGSSARGGRRHRPSGPGNGPGPRPRGPGGRPGGGPHRPERPGPRQPHEHRMDEPRYQTRSGDRPDREQRPRRPESTDSRRNDFGERDRPRRRGRPRPSTFTRPMPRPFTPPVLSSGMRSGQFPLFGQSGGRQPMQLPRIPRPSPRVSLRLDRPQRRTGARR